MKHDVELEGLREGRPKLPDWFASSFVTTRRSLETVGPWVSLHDQGADDAWEHTSSPSDSSAQTPKDSDVYQIDSHVYNNLLALVRPSQHSSISSTVRFEYDVVTLRLPGQLKQPSGLDFLAAVAKRIAKDIRADFIYLDYGILQAIRPRCENISGTQRRLVRQGTLGKPVSSSTKFKLTDYFYEILSISKGNTRERSEEHFPESQAFVVAFVDLWRETGDESQPEEQEEIQGAFREALRSFSTRHYPVLVVAIDVPAPLADHSSSTDFPFQYHDPFHSERERDDDNRYDLMSQLGRRPLRQPIEICPMPSKAQRQLLKRDQERKVVRDNIRRIQSYARRSPTCTTSRLLEPSSNWKFLRSSPGYKLLSDPDLSNNQVVSIASRLRLDCSEANIRLVVCSALAWSDCLNSWADERESKRAETLDIDEDSTATNKDSADCAARKPSKTRDIIERIKKDKEEFKYENRLIDSIIEPADMTCTWDDINIDEAPRSYIKRLMAHNFSRTKPYGVLKSGGVRGALLYGPPGTGKTHLARILAKESNAPMIYVSAAELESCWVGETEKIIKGLFRLGRMLFPSIVFIDEAEAFLKARAGRDQRWEVSQVNQFLREADGLVLRKDSPFLLLATNNPMLLDKAVLRRVPGTLYIGPPSLYSRQEIFRIILRDEDLDASVDLSHLASRSHRYSGSDIKAVCFNAASTCQMDLDNSADERKDQDEPPRRVLKMAHFEEAFKMTRPTVTESVMKPLSEFASEFDRIAYAGMKAFKNEDSAMFYDQLKQSNSTRPIGHDNQTLQNELTLVAGDTSSSNTTDIARVHQEERHTINGTPAESEGQGKDPESPSHYLPLDISTNEIRLLQIVNPDKLEEGGAIRCSLHVMPLSDRPLFTALSYVWGESGSTEEIWLDGCPLQVRANLTAALRWTPYHWSGHFPGRPLSDLRIWADALCINQQNLLERNHQVAMMGDIYTQAELVISSIASEDPSIRLALETYRNIHATLTENRPSVDDLVHRRWLLKVPALKDMDGVHGMHDLQPGWSALCKFVVLPYWRRVWIIQEVFLARHVLLTCDFEALDFTKIYEISSLLSLKEIDRVTSEYTRIQGELAGSAAGRRVCCTSCYDTIRKPAPILDIYGLKFGGATNHIGTMGLQIRLLRMMTQLQASDSRDVVYGLLGLSKLSIDVDYSQTVGTVFSQYVQHWIHMLTTQRGGSQDATEEAQASLGFTYCLVLAGSLRAEYATMEQQDSDSISPSWVPIFRTVMPESQFDTEHQFRGEWDTWKFPELFGPKYTIHLDYPVLAVDGIRVDLVARSTELAENADESLHWAAWDRIRDLITRGTPYVTGIPPLQALIRVLRACSSHATLPITKKHAQELVMGSTLDLIRWMLPVDEAGVRRPSIRLLDPEFQLPFSQVDDVPNICLWIARTACPNFPELEEMIPDYFKDWEKILKKLRGKMAYTNVSLIELKGGFLGLGPSTILEGDIVCIIQGCHRPVVLRKQGDHYTFLGTCYVLGLMRWDEVKDIIHRDNLQQEKFNIR